MAMNLVIQQRRKELGLTQEQVAEALNVSIPAVSKWEKGITSPDISLLPSLARLLKVDLNILFCFQEDISQQEIGQFCRETAALAQERGIPAAFEAAEQKIREYPHNEILLHCLAVQLDGLLAMSGLSGEEGCRYDNLLMEWYRCLAGSSDGRIRNSANFMMASRLIRGGRYDKAQEILDSMPDKEDALSSMADKQMLQVNLYLRQGKGEEAVKELQKALLMALNKAQMLLYKLVDGELACGNTQAAEKIADKASRMPLLLDLWEYNSLVASLQIAGAKKDADECIRLLQKLLEAVLTPWDMGSSPLFYRIAKASGQKQMLPAILAELERDPAYGFLQGRDEFQKLISKYQALI